MKHAAILRRLMARYGPDLVTVHGYDTGVQASFATAAKGLRIRTEGHSADFDRLGEGAEPFRNREMVRAGAKLCITVHRSLAVSRGVKDCARQSIAAGIVHTPAPAAFLQVDGDNDSVGSAARQASEGRPIRRPQSGPS